MKKIQNSILLFFLLVYTTQVKAQVFTTQKGVISFYSTARMEDIEATSKSTGVVVNTSTKEIYFKVLISTFVFKNGLMQEHFNETYMESEKYPTAQFKGVITDSINYKVSGVYPVSVKGALTIHGVTIDRAIAGTLTITATGVNLSSTFIVPAAAHKIDIPNDKISNIAQDIKVRVQADCIPYVKK
jgi:polyisoprenoid-binding protein YceI